MMKNVYLIAAAAAAVLVAGCAKNEVIQTQGPGDAVSFGVYVPKTVTKAGEPGTITTDGTGSTTSLQTVGFGVFATYSDGGDYASSIGPNFMYNQKVAFTAGQWKYDPVKYWPNETINDSNNANSAHADKLSFLAYAPFVGDVTNGNTFTGSTTEGITALTGKGATTDPKVTYTVSATPETAVDLLWAVAPAGGFSYIDVHNTPVTVAAGMPLLNLTKPSITTTIPFRFRHATSRISLSIVGAFDQVAAGGTLDPATKVTVEQVKLTFAAYSSGVLNLKNTAPNTPNWELGGASNKDFTVSGTNLNTDIKDSGTDQVQTVTVTNLPQNVFKDDNTFFTVIPKAGSTTVTVEITYYVTTKDDALTGGISRVKNVIAKNITFADGFEAGKSNNIKIILGLTSVKLEASVEPWAVLGDTPVDLPINKEANSFDLVSSASVTLDGNNDGTTDDVWTTAEGEVTIDGTIKKDGVDFANVGPVISLTGDKKISFDNAGAGVYVIPLKAAGDATHAAATKTITVTVS